MGLETAVYIDDLVTDWPTGSDKIRQGDDHLRLIKVTLKNSFPNVDGAVTATPAALNSIPYDFAAFVTEMSKHFVPTGAIIKWSGAIIDIPVGYHICDGTGGTPDLRGLFIVGAGTLAVGATGGANSVSSSDAGGHTPVVQGHALTSGEMPAHFHTGITLPMSADDNAQTPMTFVEGSSVQGVGDVTFAGATTGSTGGGTSHTHGADAVADHHHTVATVPPYYALAFIKKTSSFVMPVAP